MPLNDILIEGKRSYRFTQSQKTMNYVIYMDDIKIFAKTKKQL